MSPLRLRIAGSVALAVTSGFAVTHMPAASHAASARSQTRASSHAAQTSRSTAAATSSEPAKTNTGATTRLPMHPVGGEGGVAAFPFAYGEPVARFTVTTPVRPGQLVHYTNESYDTTPGVRITASQWSGRQDSYEMPGVYPVSLTVRDSLGRVSAPYTQDVVVAAPAAPSPPVAYFVVTSPVSAGSLVTYTDESYDPGGEAIVDRIWTGRQDIFVKPGAYPISLRVENAAGQWSQTFTREVVVTTAAPSASRSDASGQGVLQTGDLSSTSPVASNATTAISWSVTLTPNPATNGQVVTVTATRSVPGSGLPVLDIPASLQGTWGGLSYAAANASGPMKQTAPGVYQRSLTVPSAISFPSGTYPLEVLTPDGQILSTTLVVAPAGAVHGTPPPVQLEEPIVSAG